MKTRIRTQGILIFSTVVIIILFLKFISPYWLDEKADEIFDVIGIIVILSGFLVRISARGHKEEKSDNGNKLVVGGPYALMRNPMYFGTFLIGAGSVVLLFAWWVMLLFLLVFFLIYIPQVRKEEALLLRSFGQEYENYSKVTPRYFPRAKYLLSLRKYLSFKISWIKKELSSLILTIAGLIIIETWQDVRLFGKKELFREAWELILTVAVFLFIILLLFGNKKASSSDNYT